jgi:pilus assembly protein FimV
MAIDKDPSIYRERGAIGSSDELDEYGVWVKSEPQVLGTPDSAVAEGLEPALPDIEDLPDLDLELSEDAPAPDIPDIPDIAMDTPDELVPDFSDLPSFSMEEEPAAENSELSIDDFLDTSESSSDLGMDLDLIQEDAAEAAAPAEDFPLEPAAEPAAEASADFDDFLNDLADQSEPTPPPVSAETLEGELEVDLVPEDSISVELSASEGLPEIEPTEVEVRFDDVAAFSKEMAEPPVVQAAKPDLSTELLMRIAEELASIKNELSSLKGELSVLRTVARAEAPMPAPASPETEGETPAAAPRGFFDEEEDETIALTGDGLDNILNTADFTEEAGSDAGAEVEAEAAIGPDLLSDKPDILTDEEAPVPTVDQIVGAGEIEPAIESIDIPEEGAAPSAEDLPLELAELRESGVTPMTPAPEDTSYLEEEQIDLKLLAPEGHLDLTEAVIEEPDLGDFTLEEPQIEEPSIDSIDIDLDLEDNLKAEEIILPMETKEESFEELIPEGFVVESAGQESAEAVELEPETVESAEPAPAEQDSEGEELPQNLRQEVRAVLSYMDQLLESLPESKIEEFAKSEYFDTYKKLFEELGIA